MSQQQVSQEIAELRPPSKEAVAHLSGGRYITPQDWATLSGMAQTLSATEFVPKGLRGRPAAVLACLLYGRDLGLPPTTALASVYIVDGKPTLAGPLFVSKIRKAGHKLSRELHRNDSGTVIAVTAHGERGDTGETDSETFSLEDAERADLLKKDNWIKYPARMMWWRAVSGIALILFPDVFLGMPLHVPEEIESDISVDAAPRGSSDGTAGAPVLDFGANPVLGARIAQLFEAADQLAPGSYRPAKQATLLRGCRDDDDRRELIAELEAFIVENGGELPEATTIEGVAVAVDDAEAEGRAPDVYEDFEHIPFAAE